MILLKKLINMLLFIIIIIIIIFGNSDLLTSTSFLFFQSIRAQPTPFTGPHTAARCFWTLQQEGYTGGSYAAYMPGEVDVTTDGVNMVVCIVPPVGEFRFASDTAEAPADGDTVAVEIAIWDTRMSSIATDDSSPTNGRCRSTNTVQFTYQPSGVWLKVTGVTVTSHTKTTICYKYNVTNVGDQTPPADCDPQSIMLNAKIKALDDDGATINEYNVAGFRAGFLPAGPSEVVPGASFESQSYCAPNRLEEEVYLDGVTRGNLHLYIQMTGLEYATQTSDVAIIGQTATTTKRTTSTVITSTKTATTKTVTATTATTKTTITVTATTITSTSTATTATTSSTAATTTVKRCPHEPNREIGRCGPLYEHLACPALRSPYCNANNGHCGSLDAHRDAQESTEYDFCDDESDTGNEIINLISNDDAENDEGSANNDDAGGDSSTDGAATTVGSKVAGDPNSQNQDSTNTTANSSNSSSNTNSSSDRFNNTAVLGGGGNDDDDYGGDDDAVASAVVNQTSLIVGIVLGVVFLIAASVGLTICIQKRKSGAEAHAIPTQAVLTNFKARDRTESEGGQ